VVWASFGWLMHLRETLDAALAALALNTFDLMRALAIGLFPVFLVLCGMALHRGVPARGALIAVTLVFILLLAAPLRHGEVISDARWTGAFLLVLVGSVAMTRRLSNPASFLPGAPAAASSWGHRPPPGRAPWPPAA
jgi:hypothetical protein